MPRSEMRIIKQHFGNRPFRVREAVDAGIPRHQIYRLRDKGDLVVLSRGVMQSVDSDPAMNTEFAALAARVPDGTICLSSGLSYWDLSDELPARIDLAVPRGANGKSFGLNELRVGGRGGHLALTHLEQTAAGSITVRYRRSSDHNSWSLVDERLELGANTPCSLTIRGSGRSAVASALRDAATLKDCAEIHVYWPPLRSISDLSDLFLRVQEAFGDRIIVMHGTAWDSHVRSLMENVLPNVRIAD